MAWEGNWNLDPPPGLQGLRHDLPLRIYVRHMPHWRQEGATYFVTFRLADSIPESRRHELERLKSDWEAKHRGTQDKQLLEELACMVFERIEDWLDQGTGSCVLKESRFSLLVHQSMQHFHGQHYELGASVVMPNHVHCIIRPLAKAKKELEEIIGSWKSFTSRRIHIALGQEGRLWQDESYDRIVRDEEHLWRCIQYIGNNPKKAGVSSIACQLWLNPDWENLGWKYVSSE
ncbi:MAG: transposase [Pirellula sp.]|jgi:REP element-mobilizing transposase RayT|nr:transposase [Pirellula sp.]